MTLRAMNFVWLSIGLLSGACLGLLFSRPHILTHARLDDSWVKAARSCWGGLAEWHDEKIAKSLQDPANFREYFPIQFAKMTDAELVGVMSKPRNLKAEIISENLSESDMVIDPQPGAYDTPIPAGAMIGAPTPSSNHKIDLTDLGATPVSPSPPQGYTPEQVVPTHVKLDMSKATPILCLERAGLPANFTK